MHVLLGLLRIYKELWKLLSLLPKSIHVLRSLLFEFDFHIDFMKSFV